MYKFRAERSNTGLRLPSAFGTWKILLQNTRAGMFLEVIIPFNSQSFMNGVSIRIDSAVWVDRCTGGYLLFFNGGSLWNTRSNPLIAMFEAT